MLTGCGDRPVGLGLAEMPEEGGGRGSAVSERESAPQGWGKERISKGKRGTGGGHLGGGCREGGDWGAIPIQSPV